MRGFGLKTSIIIFLLIFTLSMFADDSWQGSAAIIRRGEFESSGMYAASNSFTPNSKVRVVNQRTGQSVEVTILKRIENAGNVLLLLSEEAASVIGMTTNDIVNVNVYLISYGYDEIVGLPDDLPFNPDPDVYPVYEEEPTYTPIVTVVPTPEVTPEATIIPTAEPTLEPTPVVTPELLPEITEEPTSEPMPELTPEPTAEPTPEISLEPTSEPTPELTLEPTPELTAEPTIELTPEPTPEVTEAPEATPEVTLEPTESPSPEINEGATLEPTPQASPMPSLDPVPEPTLIPFENPGVLTQRSPQKNFFLPPREDESYFLSDLFLTDDNAQDDFPVNEAGLEDEGSVVSQSINPVYPGKTDYAFNLGSPDVEKPVTNNFETPKQKERPLNFAQLDMPSIESGKTEKPEVLLDKMQVVEKEYQFNTSEPSLPGQKTVTMEASQVFLTQREKDQNFNIDEPRIPDRQSPELQEVAGIYMRADEAKVSILPAEPLPPQEKTSSKPEVYADFPMYNPEEHSFVVSGPAIPPEKATDKPVATEEIPLTEESYIAFNTSEPPVPEKKTGELLDITNDVPDPDYEGEVDVVLEPTEPKPPKGAEETIVEADTEKTTTKEDKEPDQSDTTVVVLVEDKNRPPVNVAENLEQGFFYVQLAAYTDNRRAQALANQFKSLYPVKIISSQSMKLEVYKVLLGPLSRDESDTLLYRFKALGYRDAFVKFIK